MTSFSEISAFILEKFSGSIADMEQFKGKKGLAYGGIVVLSLILFLTMGGGKQHSGSAPASEDDGEWGAEVSNEVSEAQADLSGAYPPNVEVEMVVPVHETWGRDPFAPAKRDLITSDFTAKLDLRLTAISWAENDPLVLINDSILGEGDFIDGAEVVEIYVDAVILLQDGERIVLPFNGEG